MLGSGTRVVAPTPPEFVCTEAERLILAPNALHHARLGGSTAICHPMMVSATHTKKSLLLGVLVALGLTGCGAIERLPSSPGAPQISPERFRTAFTKNTGVKLLKTFPEDEAEDEDLSKDLVQLDAVGALEGPKGNLARTRRLYGDFALFVYRPGTSLLPAHRRLQRNRPRWRHYRFATPDGPGWAATTRVGRVVIEWTTPTKQLDRRWRRLTQQVRAAVVDRFPTHSPRSAGRSRTRALWPRGLATPHGSARAGSPRRRVWTGLTAASL